jgi:hypothetical protein
MEPAIEGCGIGLRREHYDHVLRGRPSIPWFEVISENFMGEGGRPGRILEQVRKDYPVGLHGVSLSPGSTEPPDEDYLRRLKNLVTWVEPLLVSDHLCWTRLGGRQSHDLLPLPFTEEAIDTAAGNIRRVQDFLGRRILIENISTYLQFRHSPLTEWEFLTAVAERADCHILLDVNNVYVNSRNHGFDPCAYLEAVPRDRVRQFHLGGHEDHGHLVIDTHDHPVCEAVWSLYRAAVGRFGPRATLIERDARVPDFAVLAEEARRAETVLEGRKGVPSKPTEPARPLAVRPGARDGRRASRDARVA